MGFLTVAFLWALPLAGAPLIIHLLHRRRRSAVQWGAMRFLLEAAPRRRRMWQLRDWLLMLMRIAVVALLVLALAQPLLRGGWVSGGAERDVVLVIDTSMSTAQRFDGVSASEHIREAVDEVLAGLRETDRVRVLLASTINRWLIASPQPADRALRRLVGEQLAQLDPDLGMADMVQAVRDAVEVEPADAASTRVVIVFSDGQAHGWEADMPARWQWLVEREQPAKVRVVLPASRDDRRHNLAVDAIGSSHRLLMAGQVTTLTATVRNAGTTPSPTALLAWEQGDELLGTTMVRALEPGEQATAAMEYVAPTAGVVEVRCRLQYEDDLAVDDEARLVLEVGERLPILVVDGAPSANPLRSGSGYLLAALGHDAVSGEAGEVAFRPRVVDVAGLADVRLSDYRAVVLADVARLPLVSVGALRAYVAGGGGLWVALGAGVDRGHFNDHFFNDGRGFVPLPLAEPVGDAADHDRHDVLHPPSEASPAMRLIADPAQLDLDRVHVYRRHRFETSGRDDVTVLLSSGTGEPLAVEGRVQRGRVIVLGLPLDHTWSRLPLSQAFVVMAHEWLWYLSETGVTRWNLRPGEPIVLDRSHADGSSAEVMLEGPWGGPLTLLPQRMGQTERYRYGRTHQPGRYVMRLAEGGSDGRALPFYVRRFEAESDLTPLSAAEQAAISEAGGLRFDGDPLSDTLVVAGETAAWEPVWAWLMLGLLGLMMVEPMVAAWLSRQRGAAQPAGG